MAEEKDSRAKRRLGPVKRFMGLFGIRYPRRKGLWILLTRRFRWFVLGSIALILGVFVWFTFYYSSTPEFCESCHFIKPYVDSWRTSTHNMVACNTCHFPPGIRGTIQAKTSGLIELMKTITGEYGTVPRSEIEDSSCLQEGCHETRLLKSDVLFEEKYKFDHAPHLADLRRGKKLRCTTCHSQIVQGAHLTVTKSVCFTCHFKGHVDDRVLDPIAGCTACHGSPEKPIETATGITFDHKPFLERKVPCWNCHADAVQGTGDVPRQICQTCHGESEKLERFEEPEFLHEWHVTKRKVECFQCHGEIRHGRHPERQKGEDSCGTCHSGRHGAHRDIYAGRGGRGVRNAPGEHFLANVDCIACHGAPIPRRADTVVDTVSHKATEQACVRCHGRKRAGTLKEWKSNLGEMLAEAKAQLAKAEKAYAALPDGDPRKAEAGGPLEAARYNCEFVEKASGVHNLNYAMDLLDKAIDSAAAALRAAQRPATSAGTDKPEQ